MPSRPESSDLLPLLYAAESDLAELAEQLGLSLEELAMLAGRADTVRELLGLRRLADVRTQLLLSRYRTHAAARLVGLASQDDDDELARKACVDLLKLDLLDRIDETTLADAPADPLTDLDAKAILTALRELAEGESDEATRPRSDEGDRERDQAPSRTA